MTPAAEPASSAEDPQFDRGIVVLKLGGSVITEKAEPETVDEPELARAAEAVGNATGLSLVVVHGGGSFGHPAAEAAGASLEAGITDTQAIRDIHGAMGRLHETVLSALHAEGVPAVPVRPFSAGYRDGTGSVVFPTAQIETMLEEGFVPVLHGDVFASVGAGATIVSGDELVVSLARSLSAEAVGLCTTVPGVLDEDEAVIARIEEFASVREVLDGSDATDVTGGMAGKVQALLGLATPAQIFDVDGLPAFLAGGSPGTRIDGRAGE